MITVESPARTAALLREKVRCVFRELPRAIVGDEEPIHQVRMAVRRLRVALPLLAQEGGGRRLRQVLRVLRQLTRALGRGRDLYVLAGVFADRLAAEKDPGREQRLLLARLRAAKTRSHHQAAEAVMDLDIDGLRHNLRRLLRDGAVGPAVALARVSAFREAQATLLLRGFSQVGRRYLPEALHALRRAIRRLRYAAEVADAVRGEDSRAAQTWKRLQDSIGALHDRHVLSGWLEQQAQAAAARGDTAFARTARRERRYFLAEGRRMHAAFLDLKPADLAVRALAIMARRGAGARQGRPRPLNGG